MKIKKSTLKTIGIVLACVLIVGALIGIFALFDKKANETETTIHPTYAVGGLTANGRFEDTKGSIYTKDAFECMGIKTTLAFDSNVSYKIYFYNEDEEFINATSKLTGNYNSRPESAKYARIVITPNDDENVSWYEVGKYSKQLTIQVDKTHKFVSPKQINRFEVSAEYLNKMVATTQTIGGALATTTSSSTGTLGMCKFVDVSLSDKVVIKSFSGNIDAWKYAFVDADGNVVAFNSLSVDSVDEDGVAIMEIVVPTGATQFTFTYRQGNSYGLYCI